MSGWSSTSEWKNVTSDGSWRARRTDVASRAPCWTAAEIAAIVIGFVFLHWQVGLAFVGLKLWHQASGEPGSAFAFARRKWEALVAATRTLLDGSKTLPFKVNFGPRSSGNHAFDAWRQTELERIEAERSKLRAAERDFAAYRDELLHAKAKEDFDRFMQSRGAKPAA